MKTITPKDNQRENYYTKVWRDDAVVPILRNRATFRSLVRTRPVRFRRHEDFCNGRTYTIIRAPFQTSLVVGSTYSYIILSIQHSQRIIREVFGVSSAITAVLTPV